MVLLGIDAGAGPAAGSSSGFKPAFSLDPAKRILLYSGVVQHFKFYSYYVTVFRALEVFRNAASGLDPRLAVNPDRTWGFQSGFKETRKAHTGENTAC